MLLVEMGNREIAAAEFMPEEMFLKDIIEQ